jgi:hypothetical protein
VPVISCAPTSLHASAGRTFTAPRSFFCGGVEWLPFPFRQQTHHHPGAAGRAGGEVRDGALTTTATAAPPAARRHCTGCGGFLPRAATAEHGYCQACYKRKRCEVCDRPRAEPGRPSAVQGLTGLERACLPPPPPITPPGRRWLPGRCESPQRQRRSNQFSLARHIKGQFSCLLAGPHVARTLLSPYLLPRACPVDVPRRSIVVYLTQISLPSH